MQAVQLDNLRAQRGLNVSFAPTIQYAKSSLIVAEMPIHDQAVPNQHLLALESTHRFSRPDSLFVFL
jgi:hypothetical protein